LIAVSGEIMNCVVSPWRQGYGPTDCVGTSWLLTFLGFAVAVLMPAIPARTAASPAEHDRPNVIVIMTDNHGAWTLGCYGNREIRTPAIDRLAREGTLFTRAFASNPVCSPTRATFLTGLMPSQHGVHSFLFSQPLQVGPEARSTMEEFVTLPEILKQAGYRCGLVGKWHLGDNLHPQEGFEEYWITMPHGGTATFYNADIIEDGKIRPEPTYLTDFWTDHATRFIQDSAEADDPFFLFLAYNGPYALGRLLLEPGRNRHAEYYADQELLSFPREPAHPWQFNNLDYHNNPISRARVATEVSGVDDGVGRILALLENLQLEQETLILFLADQGWVGGHGGFYGMGDHTRPVTARDGMMQIPLIWWQPGTIAANHRVDEIVTNYDLLPTLLSQLQLTYRADANTGPLPARDVRLPGRDFSAALAGQSLVDWNNVVFYEYESLRCVRTEDWKYIVRYPHGITELYHLATDPQEEQNLIGLPEYEPITLQLHERMEQHFRDFSDPEFNLWQGGTAQNRMLIPIEPGPDLAISATEKLQNLDDYTAVDLDFQPVELELPEGYFAQLAAGPPLVQHPTLACLDDRGRLYVCDNAGVNRTAEQLEAELPNRIRRLEDIDGDGIYDRSTVFADRMTFPMGGCWIGNSLYVASPPYIWKLTDADDDGVAETRTPIVSQFGYTGNAASIHGCFAGPDGRIYWCDGFHGHKIRDDEDQLISQRFGSYLFSCNPDGSDVRIHAGGGMDNPVEVDFTPAGEMLGTCNIMYTRPRVDTFTHWQYGGAYPHRETVKQELQLTGDFLEPIHHFGHVAVSGTMRYRSGLLDRHWRDNFFATFFNLGKVVRLELQPQGSSYAVTQREFLSSANRDFHPTDVLEDRDGSLLVIDTGGWFYRGCPTSQLAKPEIPGGIYRIRKTGMTQFVDPGGDHLDWENLTDAELLALFNDTRFWVRDRARREAIQRGPELIPALARLVARADVRPRLFAVRTLAGLLAADPACPPAEREAIQRAFRGALQDRDATIRQAVCQILLHHPDAAATPLLIERLQDADPAVQRAAAAALGRSGDHTAVSAILQVLPQAVDRHHEHALIYALIELEPRAAVQAALQHDAPQVRSACLIAADQLRPSALTPADLSTAISDPDAGVRRVAQSIVRKYRDQPEWTAAIVRLLTDENAQPPLSPALRRDLLCLLAGLPEVGQQIGEILQDSAVAVAEKNELVAGLVGDSGLAVHPSWLPFLEQEILSDDVSRMQAVLPLIARPGTDRLRTAIAGRIEDESLPPLLRAELGLAVRARGNQVDDRLFGLLLQILQDPPARSAAATAARMLGGLRLSPSQLKDLAGQFPDADAAQLRELIRPFSRQSDPAVATAFMQGLEAARAVRTVPHQEISDVIKSFPTPQRERGNALLDQLEAYEQTKLRQIDRLLPLLGSADAARGETVFRAEKSKCATCHQVGKTGRAVGPDLTTIGANRAPADLLESILFPSASIVRDYSAYTVVLSSGQVRTGLIVRETEDFIVLQPPTGEPEQIDRDDIEDLVASEISLMPKGLEQELSDQEIADLVAYLMSLRSTSPASVSP
jgi:putative membrane-bound dehydrogenase-like protein